MGQAQAVASAQAEGSAHSVGPVQAMESAQVTEPAQAMESPQGMESVQAMHTMESAQVLVLQPQSVSGRAQPTPLFFWGCGWNGAPRGATQDAMGWGGTTKVSLV